MKSLIRVFVVLMLLAHMPFFVSAASYFSVGGVVYWMSDYSYENEVSVYGYDNGLPEVLQISNVVRKHWEDGSYTDYKVTSVSGNAFKGCTWLKEVYMSSGISLYDEAFMDCTALEKVKLPEDLAWIGRQMFKNCHKLQSVSIPQTVTQWRQGGICEVMEKRFCLKMSCMLNL